MNQVATKNVIANVIVNNVSLLKTPNLTELIYADHERYSAVVWR